MADGAGKHKNMPNHIVISQAAPEMKTYTRGEKKSANTEQNQSRPV